MLKSYRFNPGFQTDDQAIASFVVRQRELQAVLDHLEKSDSAEHKILIVAPRGAGKTTLCRRVLAEVRTRTALSDKWIPIFLSEESYSVTTPGEFLLECLFHLSHDAIHLAADGAYENALKIKDEVSLQKFCRQQFQIFHQQTGKSFLLVVENFHTILKDQLGKDADGLISLLIEGQTFGVLATSVKSDESDKQHDLLGRFIRLPLKPLELSECHELWSALTGQKVDRARIRPLQILTGGSPRLIHILADFMITPSLQDLMENLNFLIDQNTEYFKSQLDSLPSQERKIFVSLLEAWDPCSAKQIAEASRVNVNTASSLLNRLTERGAVIKQFGTGRSALYHAAERLFNIYYLMRRRSHPSNRVRALVAFMTQYYDRDQLVDTTALLAVEACGVEPSGRSDYHNAFDAILMGQPESIRMEILKRTPPDFIESLRKDPAVKNYQKKGRPSSQEEAAFKNFLSRAYKAAGKNKPDVARELLMQAVDLRPHSFEPWTRLAFLELRHENSGAAVKAARAGLERAPDHPVPHTVLGIMLNHEHAHEDAARAFARALDLNPNIQVALVELAKIRHDSGDDSEAMNLFQRAADLGDLEAEDLARFSYLLSRHGHFSRAESMLTAALHKNPDDAVARRVLVEILINDGRAPEGAEILRQAAEAADRWEPWASYASYQLHVIKDASAAVSVARTALDLGYKAAPLYQTLAEALHKLDAPSDNIIAIAEHLRAELPNDRANLIAQGKIYQMAERWSHAESSFKAAGASGAPAPYPWILLGRLLSKIPGRISDAEEALRHAVEVNGGNIGCVPLKELAEFLVHRGEDEEAIALLDRAISHNQTCECSLILRGEIASRNGDADSAKHLLNKALALNSDSVPALTSLARISDLKDAEILIDRATKSSPKDPRVLLARSLLPGPDISVRINDAQMALEGDPELTEARLVLALLLAQQNERESAIAEFSEALRAIPTRMEIIPTFVNTSLQLIRSGYLQEVENLLEEDQGRPVEPLLIALRLYRGENPVVAMEIEDVARDIVEQLEAMSYSSASGKII